MLKGVTKRTIEVKSPDNKYFEGALLFIRPNAAKSGAFAKQEATKFLDGFGGFDNKKVKSMRALITILLIALGLCIAALIVLLILYTKTVL